jgi:hypothetical protein
MTQENHQYAFFTENIFFPGTSVPVYHLDSDVLSLFTAWILNCRTKDGEPPTGTTSN